MAKKARDFVEEMKVLVEESQGDAEGPHSNADDLLCEALLEAAKGNLSPIKAKRLIEQYKLVRKWYA